jgi:hypothetical protein
LLFSPPQRHSPRQNVLDAQTFAESNGMSEHAELFGRAALVAREPERFDLVSELSQEERTALTYEKDHKWHGPTMLWYSIALCAIGAATQGWDQTGSNGANLSFPQEFGLMDAEGNTTAKDQWYVSLTKLLEDCKIYPLEFVAPTSTLKILFESLYLQNAH